MKSLQGLAAEYEATLKQFKPVLTFHQDMKVTLRVTGLKGQVLYIKED
jgi:hypothetical protein